MRSTQEEPEQASLMVEQAHSKRVYQPPNFVFRVFGIFLVTSGSIVWILNFADVIHGPWSSICGITFTVFGLILGLFPPKSHEAQPQLPISPTHQQPTQHNCPIQLEGVIFSLNDQSGILVVLTKKYLRGSTINLCRGFQIVDLKSEKAAIVIGHRKLDHVSWPHRILNLYPIVYAAVFPAIEPGNYTVYLESREFTGRLTISANQVTIIDWQ